MDYRQVKIADSATVVKEAVVLGNVTIGEESQVMFFSVLRGDDDKIIMGNHSNVQENCTVHVSEGNPVIIGDYVSIGHNAVLHGCQIGDNTLIGMNCVSMDGARIGKNCLIAAGAIVTKGKVIPDGSLVVGSPGKVKRSLTPEEIEGITESSRVYCQVAKDLREQGLV